MPLVAGFALMIPASGMLAVVIASLCACPWDPGTIAPTVELRLNAWHAAAAVVLCALCASRFAVHGRVVTGSMLVNSGAGILLLAISHAYDVYIHNASGATEQNLLCVQVSWLANVLLTLTNSAQTCILVLWIVGTACIGVMTRRN